MLDLLDHLERFHEIVIAGQSRIPLGAVGEDVREVRQLGRGALRLIGGNDERGRRRGGVGGRGRHGGVGGGVERAGDDGLQVAEPRLSLCAGGGEEVEGALSRGEHVEEAVLVGGGGDGDGLGGEGAAGEGGERGDGDLAAELGLGLGVVAQRELSGGAVGVELEPALLPVLHNASLFQ